MASDIFSFGVCVLHIFVPGIAIQHSPVTNVRLVPTEIGVHDPQLAELLSLCLLPDPASRPTASVLLDHPFFQVGVVWVVVGVAVLLVLVLCGWW